MAFTIDGSAGAKHAIAVTPSDSTDTAYDFRAVSCAVSGNIVITTIGYANVGGPSPADVTIYVAAGVPFPLAGTRIKATGTTATGIVIHL